MYHDQSCCCQSTGIDKRWAPNYSKHHNCCGPWEWIRQHMIRTYLNHATILCNSCLLTHWGRDQIDAISQTTFSSAFSRNEMNEFRLGFHWSLFLRFELTTFQHWYVQIMAWCRPGDKSLSEPMMVSLLTWRIYASLGLNELIKQPTKNMVHTYIIQTYIWFSYNIWMIISFNAYTYYIIAAICSLRDRRHSLHARPQYFSGFVSVRLCWGMVNGAVLNW